MSFLHIARRPFGAGPAVLFAAATLALTACGPVDELAGTPGSLESAAKSATSADGRLKVQETPVRKKDATELSLITWLPKAPKAVETFIGGEPYAGVRKGRSARFQWILGPQTLGRLLLGEQPHLLVDLDGDTHVVASFDVALTVKVTRGPVQVRAVRPSAEEGVVRLFVETSSDSSALEVPKGEAVPMEGVPNFYEWTIEASELARLVAAARPVTVKAKIGARLVRATLNLNVAATAPASTVVPEDFHGGVIQLAEAAERKIAPTSDPAALRALKAVAAAMDEHPLLNWNVAQLAWVASEGALVAYQAHGALTEDGTRGESWWLSAEGLESALTNAAGGLSVVVRSSGR